MCVCFGVMELNVGFDIFWFVIIVKKNLDGFYSVIGQKIWIICVQVVLKMIFFVCIILLEEVWKLSEGFLLFCIDIGDCNKLGFDFCKIKKMGGCVVDVNEVFFDNYQIFVDLFIGEEGKGFKMILYGMNVECCLFVGEVLGFGYVVFKKVSEYVKECVVFQCLIGQNQVIVYLLVDVYMKFEVVKLVIYYVV